MAQSQLDNSKCPPKQKRPLLTALFELIPTTLVKKFTLSETRARRKSMLTQ